MIIMLQDIMPVKNVHRDVSMLWTYQSLLEIKDKFIIIYK